MSPFNVLSTVLDFPSLVRQRRGHHASHPPHSTLSPQPQGHDTDREAQSVQAAPYDQDEFRLPDMTSLVIVLLASALLQISFFVVVSSSHQYAEYLGGTATFSGLVIGIPTVFSGLVLIPLMKLDEGGYKRPLHFACASALLGNVLYSLAYHADFLYLILIGRIVSGFGFTFWMYAKRYCSDPRIVGIRRRTMLAGWLVLGQGGGLTIGPFLGGVLYKVGFSNSIFNGYTSPTWILAGVWAIFWAVSATFFEDVPRATVGAEIELQPVIVEQRNPEVETQSVSEAKDAEASRVETSVTLSSQDVVQVSSLDPETTTTAIDDAEAARCSSLNLSAAWDPERVRMSAPQWGVTATMCWFAMMCFFILGAWEANIPVFTGSNSPLNPFHFSPAASGNLIALGGICTLPFLIANVFVARRVQDRHTLALGTALGFAGLLAALGILRSHSVSYGSLFACWFLVAFGFNLASTVTLSLLSKQLPGEWNTRISMAIQYSNYTGRVTGAVWGGAGVKVGMLGFVGMQIALVGIGAVMFSTLWRQLKAKTG